MWKKILCAALFATACNDASIADAPIDEAPEGAFLDETMPVGSKADNVEIYTEACRKAALAAAKKVEMQNGATVTVKSIDAYNTPGFRQTLQLGVVRKLWGKTEKDVIEVDVSENDESECTVGAVRSTSRVAQAFLLEPGMYEAGATMVTPSAPCQYAAKKAVKSFIALNGESSFIAPTSKIGFLSKTAYVLEVGLKFADPSFAPGPEDEPATFVVKAEPRGKSACLIWGIQDGRQYLSSEEYDDLDDGEEEEK